MIKGVNQMTNEKKATKVAVSLEREERRDPRIKMAGKTRSGAPAGWSWEATPAIKLVRMSFWWGDFLGEVKKKRPRRVKKGIRVDGLKEWSMAKILKEKA